ncbi:hypothetical protein TNCV_3104881 [Trichonephila clavipes]|nr:hypothetical protein TNCV_3104881 [Trichonephila clavipes]
MRYGNVSLLQAGMITLFQMSEFILPHITALPEGRFPIVLCSSLVQTALAGVTFWAKVKPKQSSPTVPKIGGEVSLRETSTPTTFPRDPGSTKEPHPSRTAVVAPSIHRKSNQAARHMTQLSRHTTKPSHTNDGTHTSHHARITQPTK